MRLFPHPTTLSFSAVAGVSSNGLQAMVPTLGRLTTLTLNGSPVAFARQVIKGIEYATFQVAAGTYQATYTP